MSTSPYLNGSYATSMTGIKPASNPEEKIHLKSGYDLQTPGITPVPRLF